jgi:hypothetical protein
MINWYVYGIKWVSRNKTQIYITALMKNKGLPSSGALCHCYSETN